MKHIAHEYTLVKPDGTIIEMREYHIDSHPVFETYVLEENKKFGGNLSVRKLAHECPVLIIGQDESIYRQSSSSPKRGGLVRMANSSFVPRMTAMD
jgi:hypothetical protein